ncbi:Flavin-binding monooxygenase [Mycena venus]|uniref:Flavin-binding monooxygenase n=1 Tax=Mycena venus TaxID=2733690 RepID=A0A8H7D8L6_9AGAR|nr:Flavin-binding monooxygenase [Mycena venus]
MFWAPNVRSSRDYKVGSVSAASRIPILMAPDSSAIATSWLKSFGEYLEAGDIAGTTSCFIPTKCYLRDILVFTWNNRTLIGHERIADYLKETLKAASITQVKLDTRTNLSPKFGPVTHAASGVSSGFTFETAVGHGQGYLSLVENEAGEWKALYVFVTLADIRGHEESGAETGVYGGHTLAWHDVHRERREAIERDPHVLISAHSCFASLTFQTKSKINEVGAGQNGLNVGARFRQMHIPTLIIEKNARVGDNWRQRYPMMTLHTIKTQHTMLYQPYPENWPTYTPRDKLADWLEHYAISQDLVVWTSSRALPTPTYDIASKRWTVVVDRAGEQITLHPAHIVLAAGTLGAPISPSIPDADLFKGITLHAAAYAGGKDFVGKRTLVVGAGNSSADICQDLVFHGAAEVTMLQRSSTCVVSVDTTARVLAQLWPPNVPTDISDFKSQAFPFLLMREIGKATTEHIWAQETETHKGLREAGLKLNMGEDGSGQFPMIFERFGGESHFATVRNHELHYTERGLTVVPGLDVGVADLIRTGEVKIKQGVEISRFTENSAVFTDGSSLDVDAVVFATSYENIRDTMRGLFGDAVIDQTTRVWGVDEEGEINGCYRPSGHPGLWYAGGDFVTSRFYSKQLALEIKAIELELLTL